MLNGFSRPPLKRRTASERFRFQRHRAVSDHIQRHDRVLGSPGPRDQPHGQDPRRGEQSDDLGRAPAIPLPTPDASQHQRACRGPDRDPVLACLPFGPSEPRDRLGRPVGGRDFSDLRAAPNLGQPCRRKSGQTRASRALHVAAVANIRSGAVARDEGLRVCVERVHHRGERGPR